MQRNPSAYRERNPLTVRIEDYGMIGDCETAALVGRDGSIDWLCLPRFDSESCFAALLGGPENGRWQIAPQEPHEVTDRRYRQGSLILETTFTTAEGSARLIDFMPPKGNASDVMRIAVGIEGRVKMHTELVVRFDYGRAVPWVSRLDDGILRAIAESYERDAVREDERAQLDQDLD